MVLSSQLELVLPTQRELTSHWSCRQDEFELRTEDRHSLRPSMPALLYDSHDRAPLFTEAGRELADPAGVAALAIRRMSVGALGPVVYLDRLWPGRRGSNLIKIDIWPLPGPCVP